MPGEAPTRRTKGTTAIITTALDGAVSGVPSNAAAPPGGARHRRAGALITTGLLCLASGLVLGLGTRWGLVRYWWVAIKLVLNVVLVVLVWFLLRPGVMEVAERGRLFAAGETVSLAAGNMIFPPVVSTGALIVATVLAIFKPWGRIRKHRSPKRDAGHRK